jgi:hypothetical protein
MSSSPLRLIQAIALHSMRVLHLEEEEEEEEAADIITIIITTCTALTLDMRNKEATHSVVISPIFMQW